jgi:hypothetical protein
MDKQDIQDLIFLILDIQNIHVNSFGICAVH